MNTWVPSSIFKLAASILFVSISLVALTSASKANECEAYADSAVAQHQENMSNGCGFVGLRWNSNHKGHETYCKLVGPGVASNETEQRQLILNGCLAAAEEPEEELEEVEEAKQCLKSDIAEGKGTSNQSARSAATGILGAQRAQMIHDGYTQCIWNDLGCTGPNGDKTCYLSVGCCTQ